MPSVLSGTQTVLKDFVSRGLDSKAIQNKIRLFMESANFLIPLKLDVKDKKHDKNEIVFPQEIKAQVAERDGLSKKSSKSVRQMSRGLPEVISFGKHLSRYETRQEVSTMICDRKQSKKLVDISTQLLTVKCTIYMEDEGVTSEPSLFGMSNNWTVASLSKVESLGQENLANVELPLVVDIAVIMYTSDSTSLPMGVMMTCGNVALVARVMTIVLGLGSKDTCLAYLPLTYIIDLVAEALMVVVGFAIVYGSPLTLTNTSNKNKKGTKGDAKMFDPTLMTVVPVILDHV
eukprot:Gb_32430 [translate_table: standard]